MIPYVRGRVTKQAHVDIPEGTVEEEYARNGFFGRYAHLYRSEPLVQWKEIDGELKPRAFDTSKLQSQPSEDYITARCPLFFNDDIKIFLCSLSQEMRYCFRNADADELFFVHKGIGELKTDFGPIRYIDGDYIVIPRGTMYRFHPMENTILLGVEAFSEIQFPDRGMLGQHALFDPAVIQVPELDGSHRRAPGDHELKIQRCGKITRVVYPFDPINTVGWKGTLTTWQLNVSDIRPVSSDRYHLPPSVHTTFIGGNFVVCSFLPRPLENGDPNAQKVPFFHSNIDFDEVIFYHKGSFFSREGVGPGMVTLHPQGIHHGPQPKAMARSKELERTDEIAVMIDTKHPLKMTENALDVECPDYWKSWLPEGGKSSANTPERGAS